MRGSYSPRETVIKAPDIKYPGFFEDHPECDSDIHPRLGYVSREKISVIMRYVKETTHSRS